MTRQEVANFLGVSEKTINNYVKAGKLSVQYVPGKTSPVAAFEREQVQAFKNQQEPVTLEATPVPQSSKLESANLETLKNEPGNTGLAKLESTDLVRTSNIENAVDSNFELRALVTLVLEIAREQGKNEVPISQKLTLTIREAMAYSGRPEKAIRDAVQDGTLERVKMPRGAVGVKRSQLETWAG